jgi:hypothetical protein
MAHPFVELRWESIEFRQVKQALVRRVGGELRAVAGRRRPSYGVVFAQTCQQLLRIDRP